MTYLLFFSLFPTLVIQTILIDVPILIHNLWNFQFKAKQDMLDVKKQRLNVAREEVKHHQVNNNYNNNIVMF